MADQSNERILKLLQDKMVLKQEVFNQTQKVFGLLKDQLSELSKALMPSVKNIHTELTVEYLETGAFEARFTLGDETLLFVMHTNIFTFDKSHEIWKSPYVQKDPKRAFCGKIFIYNFLSDSFKYNRANDVGYLVARLFVNHENHFFLEGEKQLGYLYNDFSTTILDEENLRKVIEAAIIYCLDFDPFTEPFERSYMISVNDILDASLQSRIATGKRLGFKFQSEAGDFRL